MGNSAGSFPARRTGGPNEQPLPFLPPLDANSGQVQRRQSGVLGLAAGGRTSMVVPWPVHSVTSSSSVHSVAKLAVAPVDVLDVLERLVDRSLVVTEPAPPGQVTYRLLETIRAYARQHLAASGELEEVRRRHQRATIPNAL